MNRYKVYLRSGTVITIQADNVWTYNEWLSFNIGDNSVAEGTYQLIAQFAPGMWEGYQLLTVKAKETEKSGS